MERTCGLLVSSLLLLATCLLLLLIKKPSNKGTQNRPPGPPGWPVIGNMLDLGSIPHQTLYRLQIEYGPVLWLKLGSVGTLVVQTAKAATELFKNHDVNFCDRKCPDSITAHNYDQGALGTNQYGAYWRLLRRLYSMELHVNKQLDETAHIRRKCIDNMIRFIAEDTAAACSRGESGEINLAHYLFVMTFNLIGNVVISKDLLDSQSKDGHEFYDAMNKVMEWAGKPNVADYFPFLKWLDPVGIKRNMVRDMGRAMKIVARFVGERVEKKKLAREKEKNFLDVLLEYQGDGNEGPDKISQQNVKIIVLEMFFAGTETMSSSIEWGMTELLCNPDSMTKAKEELNSIVGPSRKVEEKDIDDLPYLQAVVKETLRLHPPVPLLLPRSARQNTNYMGYFVPKDTQIFVNAWAIGRDPDAWEDPLSFKPERFLGSQIDYKGQNYELIPFGAGRRICVGVSLAQRVLHLTLASLIHCFDWELGSGTTPMTIDMNERIGITLRKLVPLKVQPKKRIV
ncbi:p450 domain-containing protein [Cephalotus follicularis]|uniref:p450 domain-containing protein n=1 Tax=Cephalotus follicularis TaxID=3775 RepID=A0A1Q3B7R6_CEPFO|nr:p450 domain-containing protein [Cephalotus follicularis]